MADFAQFLVILPLYFVRKFYYTSAGILSTKFVTDILKICSWKILLFEGIASKIIFEINEFVKLFTLK